MIKIKIPSRLRLSVFERDGLRCLWCGRGSADGIKLHADHVFPESFGGATTFENLGTLCDQCNIAKSNEYFGEYLLTTIMKIPNLWESSIESALNVSADPGGKYYNKIYDGQLYEKSITFQKCDENGPWRTIKISQEFLIHGGLLISRGTDTEIRISEIKRKAMLDLKNKLRNFLFENKGYLEELDGKLLFRERKGE